jgi:hypothetical protein
MYVQGRSWSANDMSGWRARYVLLPALQHLEAAYIIMCSLIKKAAKYIGRSSFSAWCLPGQPTGLAGLAGSGWP